MASNSCFDYFFAGGIKCGIFPQTAILAIRLRSRHGLMAKNSDLHFIYISDVSGIVTSLWFFVGAIFVFLAKGKEIVLLDC